MGSQEYLVTPEQELKLLTDRLNVAGKGIILLHDPKGHTAAMLPAFLHYLGTTAIIWSIWCRPSPAPALTAGPSPQIVCESRTIKAVFMSRYVTIWG